MDALANVTEERELASPQDWWQWWDNKNEIYSTGLKPIDASYAAMSYEVKGAIRYRLAPAPVHDATAIPTHARRTAWPVARLC